MYALFGTFLADSLYSRMLRSMNKNLRLNQQATTQVLNDLILAGLVERSVIQDGEAGRKNLGVAFTEDGLKMVAHYAKGLGSIRNPTKRKIQAFNALLVISVLS
jgi:hypothetical protein